VTGGAALALLILLHVWSVWALIARPPFLDETESLQAGAKMSRGERLYKDFAEHHPPFVFALLSSLTHNEGSIRSYIVRARVLFAFFGCIAIAAAATMVWRVSRRVSAVVIFIALLLKDPNLWLRAFADVRADPPSLAFWWLGALLILWPHLDGKRAPILSGLGLGLIAYSSLWNPKWPIASAVIGIVFLIQLVHAWRHRRADAIASAAVAAIVTISGSAMIFFFADWRTLAGHVLGFTRALVAWSNHLQEMHIALTGPPPVPWLYCPPLFRPVYVIAATVVVVVAAQWIPRAFPERRLLATLIALVPATLLEIRFLYPYPAPWVQYYILWGMAGAAMIALVPQALVALISRGRPRLAAAAASVPIVFAVLAMLAATNLIPLKSAGQDSYWLSFEYFERHLKPSDQIWIDLYRYPIGGRDASYYWFGFDSVVPVALQFAKTPQGSKLLPSIREEDLPPCRLERGLEPHLRYIAGETRYTRLPIVAACFARLRAAGAVVPTPVPSVYEVVRQ
jgi:hypothetical protein